MDSTQKFSGRAEDYMVGRPMYAADFINSLYSQHGFSKNSVIADIGSGTGKFAKQLLENGSQVYCVEPNDDMRHAAAMELAKYELAHIVKGSAAETMLKEKSVDFITTAQAFHWFNVNAFRKECNRILKSNGTIFLIWNMRDMCQEVNQHSFNIYQKYCPSFKGFGGGIQENDSRIIEFFDGKYEYAEYDNPLFYDKNEFIRRSLSGSYSLKEGDEKFEEYIYELETLFERHEEDNLLTMPNKTVVYWGK